MREARAVPRFMRVLVYRVKSLCGWFLLVFSGALCSPAAELSEPPTLRDVFVGGQEGYPAYRIPALLITQKGTLLAFAEGRAHLRDHAENDSG